MDTYLEHITAQRMHAWHRQRSLLDRIVEERREPTADERSNIEATDQVLLRLKKDEEAHVARASVAGDLADWRQRVQPLLRGSQTSAGDLDFGDLFNRARTGERVQVDVSLEPSTRRAQDEYQRALAGYGGTLVPSTFADVFVTYERTYNPVSRVATIINTPDSGPRIVPRLTTDVSTGGTVIAEAGVIGSTDPTISQVTLSQYKLGNITVWSAELDQGSVVDLGNVIAQSAARDIGITAGSLYTVGNGSSKPTGFITSATNGGTASGTAAGTANDTFFAPADIIDLYTSLASPYREAAGAAWMVSSTAWAKILKFRDSTGNMMLVPGLRGAPDTVLGRPIFENPAMAAVASASKSVAFGDFSKYYIRQLPLRVNVSVEYKYDTDQIACRVLQQSDGILADTAAVKYLVSSNT